jgi:hypothetical protein
MSKAIYSINNSEKASRNDTATISVVFYIPEIHLGKITRNDQFGDERQDYGLDLKTDLRFSNFKDWGYGFNILILGFGFSLSYTPASANVV